MLARNTVYIAGSCRTPIGKFGGLLSSLSPVDLGAISARETLRRAGIDAANVEECLFGHARQAGNGPNLSRQVSVRAGIPTSVPAMTLNMACASGMRAIADAFLQLTMGLKDIILAGGAESMSRVPYLVDGARWGLRMGHTRLVDGMYQDGFFCPLAKQVMGETAETLARQYGISRLEQDAFALASQNRAEQSQHDGIFDAELVPVEVVGSKGTARVFADEHIRQGATLESLAKLPPVFDKTGSITAGNSSGITDGAASVLVVSERAVKELGIQPEACVRGFSVAGVPPEIMGIGPVPATRSLLTEAGISLRDIDRVEINEAFAAQVLACAKELELDLQRTNVRGGAIALGHPIGCSGARIIVTLIHEMRRSKSRLGLATLCASGGMGMSLLLERV